MFYRNIALTFALMLVTALASAVITSSPALRPKPRAMASVRIA